MSKTYKIPADIFREAFLTFRKTEVVYVMTLKTLAIMVFAVLIFIATSRGSGNVLIVNYILLFILISVPVRDWLMFFRNKKIFLSNVDEYAKIDYKLEVNGNAFVIRISDSKDGENDENVIETVLNYDNRLRVREYPRFFLVYENKNALFVFPKSIFDNTELEKIRGLLNSANVKNFIVLN